MDKIKELLAVLDLPEEKQIRFLCHNVNPHITKNKLADLAFRLRDEVEELEWRCGIEEVFQHCCPNTHSSTENENYYFISEAQPIHWIIAALIAKEQEKP